MVKKIFAYSYIYLILLLMYVPIFVLIVFSFTNATYIGTWNGFSFDLYEEKILIIRMNIITILLDYIRRKRNIGPVWPTSNHQQGWWFVTLGDSG